MRGNTELWKLHAVDFCLGTNERGREVLRSVDALFYVCKDFALAMWEVESEL